MCDLVWGVVWYDVLMLCGEVWHGVMLCGV